jgi:hypothetical protein
MTHISYSSIAVFAASRGGDYNSFIDKLQKDRIIPFYESHHVEVDRGSCERPDSAYGWSPEVCEVFLAYMAENNIKEFLLTD